jgi:hypothetical protein
MIPAPSIVNSRLANKNAKYMLDKEDVLDNEGEPSDDFFE